MKPNPSTSKAFWETSSRVFKKLLVLVLGVLAFFGLRSLENMKFDYYREKTAPIIIVERNAPTQAQDPEYAIKLERKRIDDELAKIIRPSPEDLGVLRRKQTDQARVDSLEEFTRTTAKSIPDARRNPFESEEKFLTYLSDNIGKAETGAKNLLSSKKKNRIAEIEALRVKFLTRPDEFESNLRGKSDLDFNDQFEKETKPTTQSPPTDIVNAQQVASKEAKAKRTNDLASAAMTIESRRESTYRDEISDKAYETRDGLYSIFATVFLTKYLKDRKADSPHPNTFSEMVLDEHRGGYVIYQVFYLVCIAVLVFGVLSPIYLLLYALPPFAASAEPLTEQAKKLLSRDGMAARLAAPEIAKTLVLSVAAIGIGAVAVIANNPVTAPKDPGEEIARVAPENFYPRPRVRPSELPSPPPTSSPGATPTTSPGATPTPPPDPSATPTYTFNPSFNPTFTVDNGALTHLEQGIGSATRRLDFLDTNVLPSKADKQDLQPLATFATKESLARLSEQVSDLPDIRNSVRNLGNGLGDITTTTIPDLRADLSKTSKDLSGRLDQTNTAITAFREGTQGPSIGKRASELLGRERYKVTRESFEVVRSLICQKPDCPSATQLILDRLKGLVDQAPMRKNTFLDRLGISRRGGAAPSPWEALIMRYNRAPF